MSMLDAQCSDLFLQPESPAAEKSSLEKRDDSGSAQTNEEDKKEAKKEENPAATAARVSDEKMEENLICGICQVRVICHCSLVQLSALLLFASSHARRKFSTRPCASSRASTTSAPPATATGASETGKSATAVMYIYICSSGTGTGTGTCTKA